jgi:hypothetical protein
MLTRKGVYVTPLPSWSLLGAMTLSLFTGKCAKVVGCHSKKADLEQFGSWLEEGLNVEIDSICSIKDVSQAFERQRERTKTGRVIIKVEKGWNL